ncbi:MAG: hypothetical protein V4600_21080 [Pseudomonadota bacterium]|uniref:hypothetical protein n=1 Tax=Pseudomonas TaxID=286 RepID=UPI0021ADD48C|nr:MULTISPECIES: hypothetical protein [Pseudomonas]MDY7553412.1 hypothetical protein [Pseudomonas sp. FG1]MEB0049859.1 hypothetical protein [Pseudomonas sp. FG1]
MLIVSAKGSGQATGAEYLIGVCLAMASAFFYAVAAAITKRLKDLPWAPMGITSKVLWPPGVPGTMTSPRPHGGTRLVLTRC